MIIFTIVSFISVNTRNVISVILLRVSLQCRVFVLTSFMQTGQTSRTLELTTERWDAPYVESSWTKKSSVLKNEVKHVKGLGLQ